MYGVRGGNIYTNSGLSTLYNAGRNGNYWSGTASTATNGYNLNFRSANVNTTNSNARGNGNSLRCLAL